MKRNEALRNGLWVERATGGVTAAIGALLVGGGLRLLLLGDSHYYVIAGIAYLIAGVLLWRRRPAGAWLVLVLLGVTVCWALWEVGHGATGGTGYAPFTQITRDNVSRLELTWTLRSEDDGPGTDESTPLHIGELLDTCTRLNPAATVDVATLEAHLIALDASTGTGPVEHLFYRQSSGAVSAAGAARSRKTGDYLMAFALPERNR